MMHFLLHVMDAIFSLVIPEPTEKMIQQKVEEMFCVMDVNKDGVISAEEFKEHVRNNQSILTSINLLTKRV